ncbi:MAG: N-succinylarginine dihydrolase [Verrucomicrobiota bacterium]
MKNKEIYFDGLVGPTHHYGGLSLGNTASFRNRSETSNPKEAALQGLAKMKFVADLGIPQGIFPPHERPHLPTLRQLGFKGRDEEILRSASREMPELFQLIFSSSSMWAANMATVIPSSDTRDKQVHFTPANLYSKHHRSLETATSAEILRRTFSDPRFFTHHEPLPFGSLFSDEGAANQIRFSGNSQKKSLHHFVYGHQSFQQRFPKPLLFPSRQSLESVKALARIHHLEKEHLVLAQQNPRAIDLGVFHNDVISMGEGDLFFYHEEAFLNTKEVLQELRQKFKKIYGIPLRTVAISSSKMSLKEAVQSYFFNSQLVTLPSGEKVLISPTECQTVKSARNFLEKLLASSECLIQEIHFLDLRQSMSNGGGPACLRLRVPLTEEEQKGVNPTTFLTSKNYPQLVDWVNRHYREVLRKKDFADPRFLQEIREALDEITQILGLGSIYSFQK